MSTRRVSLASLRANPNYMAWKAHFDRPDTPTPWEVATALGVSLRHGLGGDRADHDDITKELILRGKSPPPVAPLPPKPQKKHHMPPPKPIVNTTPCPHQEGDKILHEVGGVRLQGFVTKTHLTQQLAAWRPLPAHRTQREEAPKNEKDPAWWLGASGGAGDADEGKPWNRRGTNSRN